MEIKKLLKNLLFIDIETVSAVKTFEELSPRLKKLWIHKASFLKNDLGVSAEELYFDRAVEADLCEAEINQHPVSFRYRMFFLFCT